MNSFLSYIPGTQAYRKAQVEEAITWVCILQDENKTKSSKEALKFEIKMRECLRGPKWACRFGRQELLTHIFYVRAHLRELPVIKKGIEAVTSRD